MDSKQMKTVEWKLW